MSTKIDIVLPVYNEEAGIENFNSELLQALSPLAGNYEFHLIYVLDRSADQSISILRRLARQHTNVSVIHLSRRFGHQMSLVAGIDHSRGDALIMMDCDLQHPPELIPELLDLFERGYDIVHTIRTYPASTPWRKRVFSRAFYRLQNALSPVELRDGAADFRLVSRKVVVVFQKQIREHSQFLRGLFQWVGFSSAWVPFVSAPRAAGVTKYSMRRLVSFLVTGMLSFSKVPLRVASVLGVVISMAGFFYLLYILAVFFVVGNLPAGYASLIAVVLLIGGLELTVLGIIGEYLGTVFDEVKGRPLYIVDEIVGAVEQAYSGEGVD